MAKMTSREMVQMIKDQSSPDDDLRSFFDAETEKLSVNRFRFCISVLVLLFVVSLISDKLIGGIISSASTTKLRIIGAALIAFYGSISFVPQFRKNCFAFTMLLAIFVGGLEMLMQVGMPSRVMDQMATYTLFFIMMGFMMPWGSGATAAICITLYMFYPLGFFVSESEIDWRWFFHSNIYLVIYISVAVIAAHMNDSMRFKEFLNRKRMEMENTLLQDYQVRLNRAYERVENLAIIDTLTGAYNRSYFTRWLSNDIYKDKSCQDFFTIIMFDVDGFKTINDLAGHQQGDRLLRSVTNKIKEIILTKHLVFRYGGDEFCIILPSVDLPQGLKTAELLRSRIEKSQDLVVTLPLKEPIQITISIGITVASAATSIDADFLIKWVDSALLESKRKGRNCIHVFDPNNREIKSSEEWLRDRRN